MSHPLTLRILDLTTGLTSPPVELITTMNIRVIICIVVMPVETFGLTSSLPSRPIISPRVISQFMIVIVITTRTFIGLCLCGFLRSSLAFTLSPGFSVAKDNEWESP